MLVRFLMSSLVEQVDQAFSQQNAMKDALKKVRTEVLSTPK